MGKNEDMQGYCGPLQGISGVCDTWLTVECKERGE